MRKGAPLAGRSRTEMIMTVYIPLDLRRYPRYRNHSDHPIIRFPQALGANWGSLIFDRAHIYPVDANTRPSRSQNSLVEPFKAYI